MSLRPVAFYSIANEPHFIGLVALLNSLRLHGHADPFVVADCGLAPWQRDLLAPHAELLQVAGASPLLMKPLAPLERPAETMTLVDADVIVLRSLTPLLEAARSGVVVFADPVAHRFDPRWESLLELPPLRQQPYVNSGLVVLGAGGRGVLELVADKQAHIDLELTRARRGRPSDPFYYSDQDVWNAVLASAIPPERLEILPAELAPHPPFTAGDSEPYVLHHVDRKPWLAATRANRYSRLLPRLLLADDLTLTLGPDRVPRRFRPGVSAALARLGNEVGARLQEQRGRLGLRRRLAERRRARA
jgi:hypothetical protein